MFLSAVTMLASWFQTVLLFVWLLGALYVVRSLGILCRQFLALTTTTLSLMTEMMDAARDLVVGVTRQMDEVTERLRMVGQVE